MARITVKIDSSACIAAAACLDAAPKFFRLDEDSVSNVIDSAGEGGFEKELDVSAADRAAIEEAVKACPTGAISIVS
jgi:ferredoxin